MKISTTLGYYGAYKYTLKEAVKHLADAGFDCLDFSFFDSIGKIVNAMENPEEELAELKAYADSLGVPFNQAHAPFPTSSVDPEKTAEMFQSVVRSMKLASILGIKTIVVHPYKHLPYRTHKEELKQANYEFFKALIPYCEEYKIKIAVENMYEYDKQRSSFYDAACSTAVEHAEYVDMMNSEWVVACLDVGHSALVGEDPAEVIRYLGKDRLQALHIHDVDLVSDTHTLPGMGKINFKEITKALREIGYEGEYTLESDRFMKGIDRDFFPVASKFMADMARFLVDYKFKED